MMQSYGGAPTRRGDGARNLQLFLLATILLLGSAALAMTSAPAGYEIAMSAGLPPIFWATVIASFGIYALGLRNSSRLGERWLLALNLLGLTAVDAFLTALPGLRYRTYFTQWDVWYQVTDAWRIWSTGGVNLGANYYPGLHLLWAETSLATGVSIFDSGVFLMSPLFALKVPLLYGLSRRIFGVGEASAACAALSVVPDGVVGMFPSPWVFSILLLLMLVYSMNMRTKATSLATSVLCFIAALSMIISHPLASIFLFLSIVLVAASRPSNQLMPIGQPRVVQNGTGALVAFLPALSVLYLAWTGLLTVFLEFSLGKLLLLVESGGILVSVDYGRFSSPLLQLKVYGSKVIEGSYFLGGVYLLARQRSLRTSPLILLVLFLVISSGVLFLVFQNVGEGLGWGIVTPRTFTVAALFFPILAGCFVSRVTARGVRREVSLLLVSALLIAPLAVEISAMYPSPYTSDFNYQNTQRLYSLVDWGGTHLDERYQALSNSHVGDYAFYLSQSSSAEFGHLAHYTNTIPSPLFGGSNSSRVYLLLDIETVSEVNAQLKAWSSPTPEEIYALNRDPAVARVFDDGGSVVYFGPLD